MLLIKGAEEVEEMMETDIYAEKKKTNISSGMFLPTRKLSGAISSGENRR